jgi:hypothetical protein
VGDILFSGKPSLSKPSTWKNNHITELWAVSAQLIPHTKQHWTESWAVPSTDCLNNLFHQIHLPLSLQTCRFPRYLRTEIKSEYLDSNPKSLVQPHIPPYSLL